MTVEFRYQATGSNGQTVRGQLSAASQAEALRLLQQQGLLPFELEVGNESTSIRRRGKASAQDKRLVIRELATLLKAGVPLGEAVESLAGGHAASQLGEMFARMHAALRGGARFSTAMAESGLVLPDYVLQMTAAAEMTGKLAEALADAATQMEYEHRLRQEMRNALIYPSVLVLSGIGATLLTFVVVVPKFANLLKNGHADLPWLSVWVLQAGMFVKEYLLWLGLGALALLFAGAAAFSKPKVRARAWERLARAPLLGRWLVEIEIGRWASLLGILLENRVPIVRAMELAQDAVKLEEMRLKFQFALRDLRAGKRLADALASTAMFSPSGLNLIRVGERSGELASMLRTLASLYEGAASERMKRFLILLEPVAILLIGAVIGTIMIAIMMAITGLSTSAG
ncbi:MAG TPA: type II secretion system F family protein [Gallionella sp.]|nr:type II secretion system F family protein [Gallionella sp.]